MEPTYLTIVGKAKPDHHRNPFVWVQCVCGKTVRRSRYAVQKQQIRSCGCMRAKFTGDRTRTHGMSQTPIYRRWCAMHNRCYRKKDIQYKDYGGRGISVCDRWHDFELFLKDMGLPPKGHQLDREHNDKSYNPSNCKWVTPSVNCVNTQKSKRYIIEGAVFNDIHSATKTYGVSRSTIYRWCGLDKNRPHQQKPNSYTTLKYPKECKG